MQKMMETWLLSAKRTVVVDEPGCVKAWTAPSPTGTGTVLVVYRSVLTKDTSLIYKPVADLMLQSGQVELIVSSVVDDPAMLFGRAELFGMRLSEVGAVHSHTAGEIKHILEEMGVA